VDKEKWLKKGKWKKVNEKIVSTPKRFNKIQASKNENHIQ